MTSMLVLRNAGESKLRLSMHASVTAVINFSKVANSLGSGLTTSGVFFVDDDDDVNDVDDNNVISNDKEEECDLES